jgi:hypothetical protein
MNHTVVLDKLKYQFEHHKGVKYCEQKQSNNQRKTVEMRKLQKIMYSHRFASSNCQTVDPLALKLGFGSFVLCVTYRYTQVTQLLKFRQDHYLSE